MTCKACGYDEEKAKQNADFCDTMGPDWKNAQETTRAYCKPWIELHGIERGPFTVNCGPGGEPVEVGQPAKLYACPHCGTVRMEVE